MVVVVQLLSGVKLLRPHVLQPARLLCPWASLGKNTGVGCPPPGDLPNPGIKPTVLTPVDWQVGSLSLAPPGKPLSIHTVSKLFTYTPVENTFSNQITIFMYAFFFVFSIAMSSHNDAFEVIEVGSFLSHWLHCGYVFIQWRRKWQPTPAFLPGKSHERGAWQATAQRVTREPDTTQ